MQICSVFAHAAMQIDNLNWMFQWNRPKTHDMYEKNKIILFRWRWDGDIK